MADNSPRLVLSYSFFINPFQFFQGQRQLQPTISVAVIEIFYWRYTSFENGFRSLFLLSHCVDCFSFSYNIRLSLSIIKKWIYNISVLILKRGFFLNFDEFLWHSLRFFVFFFTFLFSFKYPEIIELKICHSRAILRTLWCQSFSLSFRFLL